MNARRVAPDRVPIPRSAQTAATAGIVLLVGFLLLQTPPVAAAFSAVAELLAICAAAMLRVFGFPIVRTGIELRDSASGHAIVVTESCDGSSLVIAGLAVVAWLWRGGVRDAALLAVSALIGIFAFNLLRVVVLFVSIGVPAVMSAQHLFIAPLLSAVLVSGLAIVGLRLPLRDVVRAPQLWIGVAILAAMAWYPVAEAVTCVAAVPFANTVLWLAPGELERAIVCGASNAIVSTSAVVGYDPTRVLDVPFYPSDYTLALPLVAASLALARRSITIVWGAIASLALFSTAMALGAMTASQDASVAAAVTTLMGTNFTTPFAPVGETGLALLKSAQNALVHFNLFLLPLAVLQIGAPPATPLARAAVRPASARGGRGNR